MQFRTEIETLKGSFNLSHGDRIVLLGSCFADNIGSRLESEGFQVTHNPMGPLFNPMSIARVLQRNGRPYTAEDLVCHDGVWHCLDWANRYQNKDREVLLAHVNREYQALYRHLREATALIITFGNTKVYEHDGQVAGNCHKLPAQMFETRRLTIDEIVACWTTIGLRCPKLIFTLSPVRYTEGGLAASTLAKATLRVALDKICRERGADYFPAYEIVTDDLRDYRFYADDLKHPSAMAVDYIYNHFANAYFTSETVAMAKSFRREWLAQNHIQK